MKRAIAVAGILALTAAVGCSLSSPGGGMAPAEGFRIAGPLLDTAIKQGELQTVTVSLHRGESFKRDVKLEIEAPTGISVDPTLVEVRASDKPEVQLKIAASKDAALGEYPVYVKGTPETGQPTTMEFKVKVVSP